MQAGFENMDVAAQKLGFELHPMSVIHDSNQNLINVVDLPYIYRIYNRYFREYEKHEIGVDFKYDLELLRNYRDHTVFEFDFKTSIMTFEGPEDDINYYVNELSKKWKIEWVSKDTQTSKPASDDLILDFSKDYNARSHQYCMHPMIKRNCPIISGAQYKIIHDWDSDELIKEIDTRDMNSLKWD